MDCSRQCCPHPWILRNAGILEARLRSTWNPSLDAMGLVHDLAGAKGISSAHCMLLDSLALFSLDTAGVPSSLPLSSSSSSAAAAVIPLASNSPPALDHGLQRLPPPALDQQQLLHQPPPPPMSSPFSYRLNAGPAESGPSASASTVRVSPPGFALPVPRPPAQLQPGASRYQFGILPQQSTWSKSIGVSS